LEGFEFLDARILHKTLYHDMPQMPVFAAFLCNVIKLHILAFGSVKGKILVVIIVVFALQNFYDVACLLIDNPILAVNFPAPPTL